MGLMNCIFENRELPMGILLSVDHIFDEDPVSRFGRGHEHVCDGADDLAVLDDDRADRRIRTRMPLAPFGELQRSHQKTSVSIAQKHD